MIFLYSIMKMIIIMVALVFLFAAFGNFKVKK